MKKSKLLEVGDILYGKNTYGFSGRFVIERVTKTQAISGKTRWRREYRGYATTLGDSASYSRTLYYLETPKLREDFYKAKAVRDLRSFDFSTLPLDALITITELINDAEKTE